LLADGTEKGQSAAQETPMKPTTRAAWRERWINASQRDRYLLVIYTILMVSGAVALYRHPIGWWQALIMVAILAALSPFLWERKKR
jgi:hypothetical protein